MFFTKGEVRRSEPGQPGFPVWGRLHPGLPPSDAHVTSCIMRVKGIKYVSLYGPTGYFATAKRCMLGLQNAKVPLTWTPMIWDESAPEGFSPFTGRRIGHRELDHLCNRSIKYDTVILHLPPDLFPAWIEREKGKRLVGYTIWETERLPGHWPDAINRLDLLLTPTDWNFNIFRKGGVTTSQGVLPYIALSAPAPPRGVPSSETAARFVFYAIESWTHRKDLPRTINAYLDAFTSRDPTLLIVKTIDSFYNGLDLARTHWKAHRRLSGAGRFLLKAARALPDPNRPSVQVPKIVKARRHPAQVKLLTGVVAEQDLEALHASGHCYVSLAHAEGWGLGPFDAAARGRPVIITGYGGPLHYLPQEEAFLVNYRLAAVGKKIPGAQFHSDDQWAEADQSQASQYMRHVFENRAEAQARGRRLQKHILENFDEGRVIRTLLSLLLEETANG